MGIATSSLLLLGGSAQQSWNTELGASHATAKEKLGAVRWDLHDIWGLRGFQYLRCDQSGGCTAGQLQSFAANVAVNNITSGTTTSITTSGLTADIHVNGLLYCLDDAGAAGAAPEGQIGRIVANTTTVITIHTDDAFTAAPAVNDDFVIIKPWVVGDSADGDFAASVAGVAMADQDQYDFGWFQFYGVNPSVDAIAAGTTIPAGESVVANTAVVNDGAGDAADLRIGKILHQLTTDTVLRKATVDLFCGAAFKMSNSTS